MTMKRIPRIKFPQRRPKPSGTSSSSHNHETNAKEDAVRNKSSFNMAMGGNASDQPTRMPVSKEEIEAVLLGGCI